jgi:hypothetical protein
MSSSHAPTDSAGMASPSTSADVPTTDTESGMHELDDFDGDMDYFPGLREELDDDEDDDEDDDYNGDENEDEDEEYFTLDEGGEDDEEIPTLESLFNAGSDSDEDDDSQTNPNQNVTAFVHLLEEATADSDGATNPVRR